MWEQVVNVGTLILSIGSNETNANVINHLDKVNYIQGQRNKYNQDLPKALISKFTNKPTKATLKLIHKVVGDLDISVLDQSIDLNKITDNNFSIISLSSFVLWNLLLTRFGIKIYLFLIPAWAFWIIAGILILVFNF